MSVSVAEAKRDLSQLLHKAKQEPVVITRRNVPDAVIISYDDYVKYKRTCAYLAIVRLAEKVRPGPPSLQDILDESRRELEERTERILGERSE
jgi:prevent-host-death family protein